MSALERRDLVVSGAVQRHQMRQWLNVSRIRYDESLGDSPGETVLHITATSDQWEKINEWVEQTKVER